MCLGTLFDYDKSKERLEEVDLQLSEPDTWSDQQLSETLSKERARLTESVVGMDSISVRVEEADELAEIAADEQEADVLTDVAVELDSIDSHLKSMEFKKMFSNELDSQNAFVDIQFGEGGTESQDWANMLLRMYLQWCEKQDYKATILEYSEGDVAGIRSSTVQVEGDYAYGWLRTESGVHRLVRNSPFDSNHRRHTSFASVFVYAEIDDDVEVEIDPSDVRTDTYRASGAGGQHVNQTDSAVRLTHVPTNTVVQCQSERSQHKNRAQAWKQLRAKLYSILLQEKMEQQQAIEDSKPNIGFGSQIRSYVLDQSRVKDHRTGAERGDPSRVLDGDISSFMEASLIASL